MDLPLRQRGRASVDFLAAVGAALGGTRRVVAESLQQRGFDAALVGSTPNARAPQFDAALADIGAYRTYAALREWNATHHGPIAMESFDEVRDEIAPRLRALSQGPTTLEPTLGDALPAYHDGVAFHRTGSWDAHDFMGAVHGEIVHRRLVGRNFGGDIYAQRRGMLAELRRESYARILELGTSSGNLTVALSERFPRAQITGIDLSRRMLEHAQRLGNERGQAWRLFQRAAEDTGFADASFDLVTAYALGHEVPARVFEQILRESWRVLEPEGELLFGDVVPFGAQDPLAQCWADHEARHGGEPYWREFASLDLAALATSIGFRDVRYTFAGGPRRFPYVLHALKPGAGA